MMTPEYFVEAVVDAYRKSREPLHPHAKLQRGESRNVASETEDLLAHYLVTRLPIIEQIFINQPLRADDQALFKPDLVICQGSEICALIDVKMDLGYKRKEFPETLKQTDKRMLQLRGKVFSLHVKNGDERERRTLPLSQKAKYLFVIISNRNVSPAQFLNFEKCASSLCNTRFLVLTRNCHPNDRFSKEMIMKRITICHEAFQDLEHEIQRVIAERSAGDHQVSM